MAVLEAILVALLVLTAILFVSNVQRPQLGSEAGGVDLARLASETLTLLRSHNFTDSNGNRVGFEEWVNRTLDGDVATTKLVDEYITKVLPAGTRHLLSISNGVSTLRLAPWASPGLPRNARAAEIPFFPHWTKFRANATNATEWAAPGQAVAGHTILTSFASSSSVLCLKAPDGSRKGPGGLNWTVLWRDGSMTVPAGVPYGVWAGYTNTACTTAPTYARIALRNGVATDYPLYGLRMVVWFGA